MPRFTLTPAEHKVLAAALATYAATNRLFGGDALVAAAAATMTELHAVATQYLDALRAKKVAELAELPAVLAAIDSTKTKV